MLEGKGYEYRVIDTMYEFHNKEENLPFDKNCKYKHYGWFNWMLNMLTANEFDVNKDPSVPKLIRKDYYIGRKGDLLFKANRYPAGFNIIFYQEIATEHKMGGYYDFKKFEKMPYMIRLEYKVTLKKIIDFMDGICHAVCTTHPHYKYAEDRIKAAYVDDWCFPQTDMNFSLSDLDGDTAEQEYNAKDRDGKILHNGEIKYFRSRDDGRIYRGKIYHAINSIWFVILDKYNYRRIDGCELFDIDQLFCKDRKEVFKRQKAAKIPEFYRIHRKELSQATTKELLNELKRRGINIRR